MGRPGTGASSSSSSCGGGDTLTAGVLRRVGLSILSGNDEFDQQSRQQAHDVDSQLQELRRQAQAQAAKCLGQLDVVAKEARAEEERRLVSEKVARELEAFRAEQQRKEARENERLSHLYRALLEPSSGHTHAPHTVAFELQGSSGAAASAAPSPAGRLCFRADGAQAFPSVIYSAVNLLEDDEVPPAIIPAPAPSYGGSHGGHRSRSYASCHNQIGASASFVAREPSVPSALRAGLGRDRATPSPGTGLHDRAVIVDRPWKHGVDLRTSSSLSHVPSREVLHHRREPHHRHGPRSETGGRKGAVGEAQELLQVNLARLARLEKLGL